MSDKQIGVQGLQSSEVNLNTSSHQEQNTSRAQIYILLTLFKAVWSSNNQLNAVKCFSALQPFLFLLPTHGKVTQLLNYVTDSIMLLWQTARRILEKNIFKCLHNECE